MSPWITPDVLPPATYCRRLLIPDDPRWIAAVTGALLPLIYPAAWEQIQGITAEEAASRAEVMFNEYLVSGDNGECVDMECCEDKPRRYRVNPDTGNVEQSNNGGLSWGGASGGFQDVIVEPVPPVTSGVSATKCDAATNVSGQVDVWITQVSNDFTTAVSVLEFGIAVIAAIAGAVLTVITGGGLLPLELQVLAVLGAGLYAAWAAGKTVFDAYWSTEIKDKILCAAYCNIGDDGSFSDSQFSAFWEQVNTELPPSPAKMLFMGFLSSVGRQGLNAMAASGMSADADCADCGCDGCSSDGWHLGLWNGGTFFPTGTEISRTENTIVAASYDRGDGVQAIYVSSSSIEQCCTITVEVLTGTLADPSVSWALIPCSQDHNYTNFQPKGLTPLVNINSLFVAFTVAGTARLTFS